jgi:predicted transcriptional regulator
MKSEDTRRIIREIAAEEGLSEQAVRMIVQSQFEGVHRIIKSAVPDKQETFRSIRLNAFCHFKVIKARFNKFVGIEHYEKEKTRRHERKR